MRGGVCGGRSVRVVLVELVSLGVAFVMRVVVCVVAL